MASSTHPVTADGLLLHQGSAWSFFYIVASVLGFACLGLASYAVFRHKVFLSPKSLLLYPILAFFQIVSL